MSGELYKVHITGFVVDKDGDGNPDEWDWLDLMHTHHFVSDPEVETRQLNTVIYNKVTGKFHDARTVEEDNEDKYV